MDFVVYLICIFVSALLMILFVLINYPYYRLSYGDKAKRIVMRTVVLNFVAIIIGWGPVVYFWPQVSLKYLLPLTSCLGAMGCVGSRFIYHEIIPQELAETLVDLAERRSREENK